MNIFILYNGCSETRHIMAPYLTLVSISSNETLIYIFKAVYLKKKSYLSIMS